MHILVLTPTFLPALGGAELVILQIYRRIAAKHSVRILTPYLPAGLIHENGSSEYDHYVNFSVARYEDRFTFMKIRGHKISRGIIPPFSLSAIQALKRQICLFKPDVINVHYVMPTGLAGLYAQQIRKIPVVMTYNGRDVPGPGVPPFWKYWHRIVGSKCSAMTFVSEYCRKRIYGNGYNHGHLIYNGVEKSKSVSTFLKQKLKSRLHLKEDDHILFALQRLDPLKRVDVLLRSVPKILHHYPNTRLIIGGKGSDLMRLKKLAADLNIAGNVKFVGFIPEDEIPAYFSLADLFLFHSTFETFGMVLAEAMNYAKAIVSVKNTAISEVVDDGKTGLLVPTLDSDAIADAVLKLLGNEMLRSEMGKKGFEKAQNSFQWDKIAFQYEQVMKSVEINRSMV